MPAHLPSRVLLARARATTDPVEIDVTDPVAHHTAAPPTPPPDVVIDLTGVPPRTDVAPPAPPRHAPRRDRRQLLIAVAAAVALVAVGVVAAVNHVAATRWRERAEAADRRADRAIADADASRAEATRAVRQRRRAQRQRRAIAAQLAVSEADAAALEARVLALASDRARSEDRLGPAVRPATAAVARSARAQVDSCVTRIGAARTALDATADATAWQRALGAAAAACQQAASDVDVLASGSR